MSLLQARKCSESAGIEFFSELLKVLLVFLRGQFGFAQSRLLPEALFQGVERLLLLFRSHWTGSFAIKIEANTSLGYCLEVARGSRMDLQGDPHLAGIQFGKTLRNGLVDSDRQRSSFPEHGKLMVQFF